METEFKEYIIKTLEHDHHIWELVPEKYKNDPEILQVRKVSYIKKAIKYDYREFNSDDTEDLYPEFFIFPPKDLEDDHFIREEIKKFIVENVKKNKDSYNHFSCYIRNNNLEDDLDIANALKEFWIDYLEKANSDNTLLYNYFIPKIIREDPDIFNARKNGWVNLILNRPYYWEQIPEEFRNHKDVINARKQRWITNLKKGNNDIKDVPKELMDDPDVIEAYRQSLLSKLESVKK